MVKWLFLPDYMTPPNPLFLLCKIIADFIKPHKAILLKEPVLHSALPDDFLLLLGASLQLQVFEEELQPSVQILAGDNCELEGDDGQLSEQIVQLRLNTVPDFMMCRLAPPLQSCPSPHLYLF